MSSSNDDRSLRDFVQRALGSSNQSGGPSRSSHRRSLSQPSPRGAAASPRTPSSEDPVSVWQDVTLARLERDMRHVLDMQREILDQLAELQDQRFFSYSIPRGSRVSIRPATPDRR